MNRAIVVLGGLFGAGGVAFSAAAAHGGGANTQAAASFLLAHAPALLALGLAGRGRWLPLAALVLAAGVMLFAGDLIVRDRFGSSLFPMAAPSGGLLMILGWIGVAVAALATRGDA